MNGFAGNSDDGAAQILFRALAEIGDALASAASPKTAFAKALEILRERINARRSFVVLYNRAIEKLQPAATDGLSLAEFRRLENRVDKSFVANVYHSNKPVVVLRTALEPLFAAVFGAQNAVETSCVVVPIALQTRAVGAFGVEFDYSASADYNSILQFCAAAAAMFANALKAEQLIRLEKERFELEQRNLHWQLREQYDFGQIVGNSSAMRRVTDQVAQIARSNTPVLLRGETGTGKELIANAIHYNSLRAKKPFVKINVAALPANSIEAELFGETGKNPKKSRLEQADGGTLFLDEIADLPATAQARLLRVLEAREYDWNGETRAANVRLIASTTKNLETLIQADYLRADLFYRLGVFTIFLPPLRERKADILQLAERFVEKYARAHRKIIKRISTPAIDMLTSYHFPGNVRELENAVERAVIVCDENAIHGRHLPATLQTADITNTFAADSLENAVARFERDLIVDALKISRGNCAKAAKSLETTERILNYKIRKYKIEPRRFRA